MDLYNSDSNNSESDNSSPNNQGVSVSSDDEFYNQAMYNSEDYYGENEYYLESMNQDDYDDEYDSDYDHHYEYDEEDDDEDDNEDEDENEDDEDESMNENDMNSYYNNNIYRNIDSDPEMNNDNDENNNEQIIKEEEEEKEEESISTYYNLDELSNQLIHTKQFYNINHKTFLSFINYNQNQFSPSSSSSTSSSSSSSKTSSTPYFIPPLPSDSFLSVLKNRSLTNSSSSLKHLISSTSLHNIIPKEEKETHRMVLFSLLPELREAIDNNKLSVVKSLLFKIFDQIILIFRNQKPNNDNNATNKNILLAQDLKLFVKHGGVTLLLRIFEAPFFSSIDYRLCKKNEQGYTDLINQVIFCLREIISTFSYVVDTEFKVHHIIFIFTLISNPKIIDYTINLLDEIIVNRSESFSIALIPRWNELIGGLSPKELANFCRILMILVVEPEDRAVNKELSMPKSLEFLRMRRSRFSKLTTSISDKNQQIISDTPQLVEKLIQILRIISYAPPAKQLFLRCINQVRLPSEYATFSHVNQAHYNDWKYLDHIENIIDTVGGIDGIKLEKAPSNVISKALTPNLFNKNNLGNVTNFDSEEIDDMILTALGKPKDRPPQRTIVIKPLKRLLNLCSKFGIANISVIGMMLFQHYASNPREFDDNYESDDDSPESSPRASQTNTQDSAMNESSSSEQDESTVSVRDSRETESNPEIQSSNNELENFTSRLEEFMQSADFENITQDSDTGEGLSDNDNNIMDLLSSLNTTDLADMINQAIGERNNQPLNVRIESPQITPIPPTPFNTTNNTNGNNTPIGRRPNTLDGGLASLFGNRGGKGVYHKKISMKNGLPASAYTALAHIKIQSIFLFPFITEIINLFFSLHVCRRKFYAQDLMKKYHFGQTISSISKIIKWNYHSNQANIEKKADKAKFREAIYGSRLIDLESESESSNEIFEIMTSTDLSLQIQLLRLLHSVIDKDFLGNSNKLSLLSTLEKNFIFSNYSDYESMYLSQIPLQNFKYNTSTSLSYPPKHLLINYPNNGEIGLISFFLKVLLQELPNNIKEKPKSFFELPVTASLSKFNNWIAGPIEIFLKGCGSKTQLLFYKYGFLDITIKYILNCYHNIISMTSLYIEKRKWISNMYDINKFSSPIFYLLESIDSKKTKENLFLHFLIRFHLSLKTKKILNKTRSKLIEAKLKIDTPFQSLFNCLGYQTKGNNLILEYFEKHLSEDQFNKFFTIAFLQILESNIFLQFLYSSLFLIELLEKSIVYNKENEKDVTLTNLLHENILSCFGFMKNSIFEDDSIPSKVYPHAFHIYDSEKNRFAKKIYRSTFNRMSYLNYTWIYFKTSPLTTEAIEIYKDKNFIQRRIKSHNDIYNSEQFLFDFSPIDNSPSDYLSESFSDNASLPYKIEWSKTNENKSFQGKPIKKFPFSNKKSHANKELDLIKIENLKNWNDNNFQIVETSKNYPRLSKILHSSRSYVLSSLILSLDPRTITYEAIYGLNSILSILLISYVEGNLPFILQEIQELSDSVWEKSKIHSESLEIPSFPLTHISDEEIEEGSINNDTNSSSTSFTSSSSTSSLPDEETSPLPEPSIHPPSPILLNLSELLNFWQEYYLRRGRDRLTIDLVLRNNFSNSYLLVLELLGDDSSPLSLNYHWKRSWQKYQEQLKEFRGEEIEIEQEKNKQKHEVFDSYKFSFSVDEKLPDAPLSPYISTSLVQCLFSNNNSQSLEFIDVAQNYLSSINNRPIFHQKDSSIHSFYNISDYTSISTKNPKDYSLKHLPPVNGLKLPDLPLGMAGGITVLNFIQD